MGSNQPRRVGSIWLWSDEMIIKEQKTQQKKKKPTWKRNYPIDWFKWPVVRLCHIVKWKSDVGFGFHLMANKKKIGHFIGKVDGDSPAEAAQLRLGDRIVQVNGVNIANENHKQVSRLTCWPLIVRLAWMIDPLRWWSVSKRCPTRRNCWWWTWKRMSSTSSATRSSARWWKGSGISRTHRQRRQRNQRPLPPSCVTTLLFLLWWANHSRVLLLSLSLYYRWELVIVMAARWQ